MLKIKYKDKKNQIYNVPKNNSKKGFVRVLYGDSKDEKSCSVTEEIKCKFRSYGDDMDFYINKIDYFVMGKNNYDLLKHLGAKKVFLVSKKPFIHKEKITSYYNKTFLINEAIKEFDEILFTDFDCRKNRKIDDEIWEVIKLDKKKKYGVQFCMVERKKTNFHHRKESRKIGSCSCLVYCADKYFHNHFLNIYDEYYNRFYGKTVRRITGDEVVLLYAVDTYFSNGSYFNNKQLIKYFDSNIIETRSCCVKNKPNIYFSHR